MKRFLTPLALATAVLMALFVAIVSFANQRVERHIEQAVKHNFAAAGLLSKLQIQAERMRRYEKEMFIYAAVADKRTFASWAITITFFWKLRNPIWCGACAA